MDLEEVIPINTFQVESNFGLAKEDAIKNGETGCFVFHRRVTRAFEIRNRDHMIPQPYS
jgi:hypothetical protein